MSWNDGYQRIKFQRTQERQAALYRELGMNDEQIKEMYEYALIRYNADRSYYRRTTEMKTSLCGDNDDGDDSNLLCFRNMVQN